MANGSLTRDEIARIYYSDTPATNGLSRADIASIYYGGGPLAVDTPSQPTQTQAQEIPSVKPIETKPVQTPVPSESDKKREEARAFGKAARKLAEQGALKEREQEIPESIQRQIEQGQKRIEQAKTVEREETPIEQPISEKRTGKAKERNTLLTKTLEEAQISREADRIKEQIEELSKPVSTGDVAVDEAANARNQEKIADLNKELSALSEKQNTIDTTQRDIVARDETGLTDNAKVEIANLESRRDKLLGYGGIQNERRAQKIQEQIDAVKQKGIASNEDYLVSRDRYDQLMQDPDLARNIDTLTDIIYNPRRAGGKASADAISEQLTGMDSESYYNALSEKYGLSREELEDMALTRHSDNRNDISEDLGEKAQKFGKEHRKLGTALSLAESIGNGVEGAYNTVAGLVTDDNRRFSKGFNATKTGLREGVKENYKSNLGKGAYDVITGLGDLGVGMLTGNAPLLLAGNTANQAILGADEKGQSARKAATYGALSGAADYYFNKVGLDKAKDMALQGVKSVGTKELLSRLGIAAGAEAGENVLQDITQSFLDEVINGNRSDLRTAYEARVAEGMDENKAFAETAKDYAKQLFTSGATGALMGAGMFGAHSIGNAVEGRLLNDALNDNSKKVWDKVEAAKQNDVPRVEEETPEIAKQNIEETNSQLPPVENNIKAAFEQERAARLDEIEQLRASGRENEAWEAELELSEYENAMAQRYPELSENGEVPEVSENLNPGSTNETPETVDTTPVVDDTINSQNLDNIPPDGNPPVDNGEPSSPDMGRRRSITNTMNKAGIVSDSDMENDQAIRDAIGYKIRHWDEVSAEAKERLDTNPDMWKEQYASGTKEIRSDTDLDTGMTILEDPTTSKWTFDSILRNIAEHATEAGQFISGFRKWANTATGALAKATQIDTKAVQKWAGSHKKLQERNNRVAKAISLIGKPEGEVERIPQTHDELKEQIIKTINEAFGEDAKKFNDDDIEYLTILAETKKVPVRTITKELEHKLETGKWFTIDESLPKKAEKALKNGQISNMLDKIINGEKPKAEKQPETYGQFLKKIENSLNDKKLGLEGMFDGLDVYYLGRLIQEDVPRQTIENELRHRIETGEWYTIRADLESKGPINQKLRNAFKQMRGEDTEIAKPNKPFDEIRTEVARTLEKEGVLSDYSDSDIEYIAHLIEQGMPTKEITSALDTKSATGRFGITEETQRKVNELFDYAQRFNEDSREFVEAQAEAYRLLAEEVAPDASPLEKFDTWRYMAMLGNPKTMLRNYVGNKLFGAVTGMSNNLAAALEKGTDFTVKKIGNREAKKAQRYNDEIARLREEDPGKTEKIQKLEEKAEKYKTKSEGHSQGIQRTKEFLNPVKDKPLIDRAKQFAEDTSWRQVNGAKYEKLDQDNLKHNRSVFKSDIMRLAEKAVDAGISDTNAVISKFATSLAGYMKANGLDESAFDNYYKFDELNRKSKTQVLEPEEMVAMERLSKQANQMDKAREYALKQAEYATFHEDNKMADILSKWSRISREEGTGLGSMMIEGAVPFKKTPANILKSGTQYSPFGAIESAIKTGKLIVENTGKNKGNLADEYTKTNRFTGKEKTVQKTLASDVIESWSKTLTGDMLAIMGYYLFNKGILTSSDKGEKYQDQLERKGNYAININGHTYTLDWAAPGVMPLLVGAEANKILKGYGISDEEWYKHPDRWIQTLNGLLDPMLETSMMSGIKDTLTEISNAVRFDTKEDMPLGILGAAAGNLATGYVTQGIPTLSGQIARTIDPIRRTTDTSSDNAFVSAIEKKGRQVLNKLPILSMLNPEYRDARGERQYNSPLEYKEGETGLNVLKGVGNLAYQMLSPGYYSKVNTTDADRLGRELYEATTIGEDGKEHAIEGVTGDNSVFADWRSSKKIGGIKLNPKQMQTFREEMGHAEEGLRSALYNSDWYNSLDILKQKEVVDSINSIADKIGQYAVMPDAVSVDKNLEAYVNAGGGEAGIQAIINNLTASDTVSDLGMSGSSKAAKALKEAILSGNTEEAAQLENSITTLINAGVSTEGQGVYTDRGITYLGDMAPEEYADLWNKINTDNLPDDPSSTITQGELLDFFNANKKDFIDEKTGEPSQEKAMRYWLGMFTKYADNSKVPYYDTKTGEWKAHERTDKEKEMITSLGNGEPIPEQTTQEPIQETVSEEPQPAYEPITTLDPNFQPNDINEVFSLMADNDLNTSAASGYWNAAKVRKADLTPGEFYQVFNAIDSALGPANGGVSKAEWVKYLNDNGLDYKDDLDIINWLYNPKWGKLKYVDDKWQQ